MILVINAHLYIFISELRRGIQLIMIKPFLQTITDFFKRQTRISETDVTHAYLDEGQQHLEMIMKNIHEAVITFSVEGEIMSVNKAAKKMLLINEDNQSLDCYLKSFDLQNNIFEFMQKIKNEKITAKNTPRFNTIEATPAETP